MLMNIALKLSRVPFIGKLLKKVYHRIKWTEQVQGSVHVDDVLRCFGENDAVLDYSDRNVDIIVPVFNAYDCLKPLFDGLFSHTDVPFHLIVINDASTDNRVAPLLEKIAAERENVSLICNRENLGFVKSVNTGLKASKHDVVILNSDVELPSNWLSRLMYPIFELEKVASATPMSNSSTITSFPELLKSNTLFAGMALEDIDAEFKKLKSTPAIYIDSPTGHGFCMAMSRQAIKKIGVFDAAAFGRGCGEENDWCMKAMRKGFRNVIVPNLFCFHHHTASFARAEKDSLVREHAATIRRRYPEYSSLVKTIADNQFYRSLRLIIRVLLYNKTTSKTFLCFTNSLGGGSMFANKDFIEQQRNSGNFVLNIRSAFRKESFQLEFHWRGEMFSVVFGQVEQIETILAVFHIDEVMVHQLCGYVKLAQLHQIILKARRDHGFNLVMDVRDFFVICPTVQLLKKDNTFCHACDNTDACAQCMSQLRNTDPTFVNMVQWRDLWGRFLPCLDRIYVYSDYTRRMVLKVFGHLLPAEKIQLGHIPIDYLRPVTIRPKNADEPVHIGVIGNIGVHKGLRLLNEMASIICSEKVAHEIKLFIIGKMDIRYNHPHFNHIGEYRREELPAILEKLDIDIVFIPSIWGETFCRTAEEGMLMKMPTACFDLGAPAERVRDYEKGLVISKIDPQVTLNEILKYLKKLRNNRTPLSNSKADQNACI
ncbi:MAG: glycosyltransferase [Planctomycetaceae bacterium]|nr:glycosyltransferase [Planctomycetaceae bacterium]